MPSKGVVKWSANWFGPDLVQAAYRGLAGRSPTDGEVETQVAAIKRDGKVSAVIRDISRLPEAWSQALLAQPAELVRQLYLGLNAEPPDADGLAAGVRQLELRPSVPELIATMVGERRRRLGLLELDAAAVVQAAFRSALGRSADADDVRGFSARLLASGDLLGFLEEVENCPEHRAKASSGRDERIRTVTGLYRALMGREPSAEDLETHLHALDAGQSVEELVRALMRTPEHRSAAANDDASSAEFVETAYQVLLHRAPEPEPLARSTAFLTGGGSRTDFLRTVADSEEHWVKLLARRAEGLVAALPTALGLPDPLPGALAAHASQLAATGDLIAVVHALAVGDVPASPGGGSLPRAECAQRVTAIYQALLGRDPEPEGFNKFTDFLAQGGAEIEFYAAVSGSEEHWVHLINQRAEWFVRVVFLALLQREPESEALEHFAASLRSSLDLRAFIAEVGFCREHRDKLLRAFTARRTP